MTTTQSPMHIPRMTKFEGIETPFGRGQLVDVAFTNVGTRHLKQLLTVLLPGGQTLQQERILQVQTVLEGDWEPM